MRVNIEKENSMMNRSCVVVDSHKRLRETLCEWLRLEFTDIDFYGTATGTEAIRLTNDHHPCLLISEIELKDMSCFDVVRQIKRQTL